MPLNFPPACIVYIIDDLKQVLVFIRFRVHT